jgi:hypothetical protein
MVKMNDFISMCNAEVAKGISMAKEKGVSCGVPTTVKIINKDINK